MVYEAVYPQRLTRRPTLRKLYSAITSWPFVGESRSPIVRAGYTTRNPSWLLVWLLAEALLISQAFPRWRWLSSLPCLAAVYFSRPAVHLLSLLRCKSSILVGVYFFGGSLKGLIRLVPRVLSTGPVARLEQVFRTEQRDDDKFERPTSGRNRPA